MRRVRRVFARRVVCPNRRVMTVCGVMLLTCLAMGSTAHQAFAQAPGWSRGQQLLSITYDECVRRAPLALQSEGLRIDYSAGAFSVGIRDVHTAVIACNPAPEGKVWVNIIVASNADGGGSLRQRLQAQMERSAAVPPPPPPPALPPPPPPPPPPPATSENWSEWLDADDPDGTGDWDVYQFPNANVKCKPEAIECRVKNGRRDWREAGQRYKCSLEEPNAGGICLNADNPPVCLDYEVRFRCPGTGTAAQSRISPSGATPACPSDFRGFRGSGTPLTCSCSPEATRTGDVYGTDIYTDDSSICRAALHAGAVSSGGGEIKVFALPGRQAYGGSQRHGVASSSWHAYEHSFSVGDAKTGAAPHSSRVQDCPGDFAGYRGTSTTISCYCSGNAVANGSVYGTETYTDDSAVCRAALHAGVIAMDGGVVNVQALPGQTSYTGSGRNGVSSLSWGAYSGSFRVTPGGR